MRAATLSLKGRALKYLAAREHSRVELVRKLAPTRRPWKRSKCSTNSGARFPIG